MNMNMDVNMNMNANMNMNMNMNMNVHEVALLVTLLAPSSSLLTFNREAGVCRKYLGKLQ
jgi:hypothetical protein